MNGDEHSRYSSNRKPGPSKGQGYSPSTNYNYNGNQTQHGNSHANHGNSNFNSVNKPHHRKPAGGGGAFKRDSHGSSDKIIKQNDVIIKLLQEIRDRLPEPPKSVKNLEEPPVSTKVSDEDESSELTTQTASEDEGEDVTVTAIGNEIPKKEKVILPDDDELDSKVNGNF